ncbi:MAG: glyoxalase [bacterium]|nr:glyoxalase [bacterium]
MSAYKQEDLETFLENQLQLFPEPVADSLEEAEYFLEDCMAVVCSNKKEVKEYLDEVGVDIHGMSMQEILEQPEVFALSGGRYLILEA